MVALGRRIASIPCSLHHFPSPKGHQCLRRFRQGHGGLTGQPDHFREAKVRPGCQEFPHTPVVFLPDTDVADADRARGNPGAGSRRRREALVGFTVSARQRSATVALDHCRVPFVSLAHDQDISRATPIAPSGCPSGRTERDKCRPGTSVSGVSPYAPGICTYLRGIARWSPKGRESPPPWFLTLLRRPGL
jgi:hypothetical protein